MLKKFIATVFVLISLLNTTTNAQTNAKGLISNINKKFAKVNNYSAAVQMQFNIPSIKLSNLNGNIFYKAPQKFRMKAKGLFFMPKQNPLQDVNKMLLDTNSYTAILNGEEIIDGINCKIINIIPNKNMGDLVMGKFWVDDKSVLIRKSEITTKSNGTLASISKYSKASAYGLPDEVILLMDVNKFKIPKMLAMDINKKAKANVNNNKTEAANIKLVFSNYKINGVLSDTVFTEP